MLRFISSKLNFTFPLSSDLKSLKLCSGKGKGLSFPRIWFNTKISYGSYDVVRSMKGPRVELFCYGRDVENFATVVFSNKKYSNLSRFLKPFDKYIWICLFVGLIFTIFILKIRFKNNLAHSFWWILTLFLSQLNSSVLHRVFQKSHFQYVPFILAWLLVCFLLG